MATPQLRKTELITTRSEVTYWIIQLFMIFSQEITAEKDQGVPGRYNKWRGLLGVMVLIVAVLYPFKMFFE